MRGQRIPQRAIFDLKTRAKETRRPIDMDEVYRRLWVNQTLYFMFAKHFRGSFEPRDIQPMSDHEALLKLQDAASPGFPLCSPPWFPNSTCDLNDSVPKSNQNCGLEVDEHQETPLSKLGLAVISVSLSRCLFGTGVYEPWGTRDSEYEDKCARYGFLDALILMPACNKHPFSLVETTSNGKRLCLLDGCLWLSSIKAWFCLSSLSLSGKITYIWMKWTCQYNDTVA